MTSEYLEGAASLIDAWQADTLPPERQGLYTTHPAIVEAVATCLAGYCRELINHDPAPMIAELPHLASDGLRVAYLRAPDDLTLCEGRGRWTVARIGSYLARHFTWLPGHEIERIVSICQTSGYRIDYLEGDAMVAAMEPTVCMASSCMVASRFTAHNHPYRAYAPEYGWELAVIWEAGKVIARAIVNNKKYVRVYSSSRSGAIVSGNPGIVALLERDGCTPTDGWGGHRLALLPADNGGYIAPYLDGDAVYAYEDRDSLVITSDPADYELQGTGGIAQEDRSGQVQTAGGDWINEEDAVYIDGEYYDADDTVETVDGDMALRDDCTHLADGGWALDTDAIWVEHRGWYHQDNDDIIYDDPSGHYYHWEACVTDPDGDLIPRDLATFFETQNEWIRTTECPIIAGTVRHPADCLLVNGEYALKGSLADLVSTLTPHPPAAAAVTLNGVPLTYTDRMAGGLL